MTDRIKITGPNRLVIMDVILGAMAGIGTDVDVDCEEEFLSVDEIANQLSAANKWRTIEMEVTP